MLFDTVFKDILEKKLRREKGLFNGIPFPFDRYRDFIPSIDKGSYHGILAGPGVGKSRLARYIYIYSVLKFSIENNYPVKIIYFALEDSDISVYKKIICHYLWQRRKIDLSPYTLDSKTKILEDGFLNAIKDEREFFIKLEDSFKIVNDATTPSEIFNTCVGAHNKFAATHHMIALIDNYANITKEKHHKEEWDAIGDLSRQYVRLKLCKEMDWTVVAILQQDMDSEKNAFRSAGKASIASLEPNLASIGGYKLLSRDTHILFGLFSPWRYEITRFPNAEGYQTDILRNNFRSLSIIKTNEGMMAPRLGLYFDGRREIFSEMPLPHELQKLETIYQNIVEEEQKRKEKFVKLKMF